MKPRIHIYLPTLLLACLSADSQKISKNDKLLLTNLQTHFRTLSADTAGGRAMGSRGEKTTADYIISELSKAGARPKGDNNGWLQSVTVDEGRQIAANALFSVDERPLTIGREWFPLSLSPAGEVTGSPAIALQESGVPWFQDLKEWLEAASGNPHFDLAGEIRAKAAACKKKGATALILYNSSTRYPDKLSFDQQDKPEPAIIPVLYITREGKQKYLKDESASVDLHIRIGFTDVRRTGHNVIGILDNGAATTVVISASYKNSSGLAGMIELARLLAASKLKNNNYLFIVFSGSGLDWPGSDYYTGHPVVDLNKVNYLLEIDQLGDFNDTTRALFIGGISTSPSWLAIRSSTHEKKAFTFRDDSSAARPGDHSAFYRHQIPVFVVSTWGGRVEDPGDPVNYDGELQVVKFVYDVIAGANTRGKLAFTP